LHSSQKIPLDKRVTLKVADQTVSEVLDRLFQNLNINHGLVEGKIILTEGTEPVKHYTISGHVRDGTDGETVTGATIFIQEMARAGISNTYRFYSIALPDGTYSMRYSFVGYEDWHSEIMLDRKMNLNIDLAQATAQLQEVGITPSDSVFLLENIHDNALTIDNTAVIQKTAAMGESDVIKSLETIPGVQIFRDGTTFFNARGGDRDQNQILVDERPIYNFTIPHIF